MLKSVLSCWHEAAKFSWILMTIQRFGCIGNRDWGGGDVWEEWFVHIQINSIMAFQTRMIIIVEKSRKRAVWRIWTDKFETYDLHNYNIYIIITIIIIILYNTFKTFDLKVKSMDKQIKHSSEIYQLGSKAASDSTLKPLTTCGVSKSCTLLYYIIKKIRCFGLDTINTIRNSRKTVCRTGRRYKCKHE